MKVLNRFIFYLAIASLFWRCTSIKPVTEPSIGRIPDSFGLQTDSENSALIDWREFFQDSSLIALIDTAIQKNPDALIALQRIEAARAGVQFSKGALLPTVNASAIPAIRRYGLYTMDGAGNATTDILPDQIVPVNLPDYFVGLQTTWEADVFGKLRNKKKAAAARYLASIQGKNWVKTNLITEVAVTYYELTSLDIELDIIRETVQIQESAANAITAQKEAGLTNEAAVKQFNAQLLNTKALEVDVRQRIIETESRINFLLGRYPQPIQRDKELYARSIISRLATGLPGDLLRNRPDIKQAELELIASRADVASAKAAFYPSFVITGGAGFQAFKPDLLFTTPESFVFSLVGGLTTPLVNRNAIKAQFKSASAYQLEALYNYQKVILNGYVEVYNEVSRIENLSEIAGYKDEESRLLTETIDNVRDLFNSRRATYIEVLVSQQNALGARLNFVEVKKQQLFSTVNLYKALGGGWK